MFMQGIIFSALTLALLSSCNPGHNMDQGRSLKGEALRSADADSELSNPGILIPIPESRGVINEDSPRSREASAPTAPAAADADETDNDNKTALEPVPIGGAYLSCRYQNGQGQAGETYRMDCEIAPVKDVTVPIVTASFHKLDGQGNRSLLKIVTEDLQALKWTIQEDFATMSHSEIQVVLGSPGYLAKTLGTSLSPVLNLVPNPTYWLAGEPNNLTADEDCVEVIPASGRIAHQNFTGLVSGPLGRMNDNVCNLNYNFLCRNTSAGATAAKWMVSTNVGPFVNGVMACSQGYSFAFPLNDAEFREVISLVDRLDIKIWVNMNDRMNENTFVTQFR